MVKMHEDFAGAVLFFAKICAVIVEKCPFERMSTSVFAFSMHMLCAYALRIKWIVDSCCIAKRSKMLVFCGHFSRCCPSRRF